MTAREEETEAETEKDGEIKGRVGEKERSERGEKHTKDRVAEMRCEKESKVKEKRKINRREE